MVLKDLIEFGMSEKEAQAYLALLELEVAGVQEISKAAGLNRSSTYVTLEALKKRGLVSVSDDKKVRRYVATSPDALLRTAEDKARIQENVLEKIRKIVPEMKALYKGTKKKPIVRVLEGREGLIAAFEETLTSKEKLMRVASSVGRLGEILPDYFPGYVKKRFSLGIKMHGIHPYDETYKMLMKVSPKNFDTPLGIPEEKYNLNADIAIFDNKIGYTSHKDGGVAIMVESKEIADVMKNIFDLAFEEAKRLNQILLKNARKDEN